MIEKKGIVLLLVIIASTMLGQQRAFAQRLMCPQAYQRATNSGLLAFEALGGVKQWKGFIGTVGAIYYFQSKKNFKNGQYLFPRQFAKVNIDYINDERYGLKHSASMMTAAFGYSPFHIKDIIYPYLLAGGLVSYDWLSSSQNEVSEEVKDELRVIKPGWLYGVEILVFFGHPRLSIVLRGEQRTLIGNFWGGNRRHASVGLRYHLMDVKKIKR